MSEPKASRAKPLPLRLLGGVGLTVAGAIAACRASDRSAPAPPPLIFSRETTWLAGPTRPDGSLDFEWALLERARAAGWREEDEGVRPLFEALDALRAGDEPRWFELARKAATAPVWFMCDMQPRCTLARSKDADDSGSLRRMLVQRVRERTAADDLDGALLAADTAVRLARRWFTPRGAITLAVTAEREAKLIAELVACTRLPKPLPADRLLACLDSIPEPGIEAVLQELSLAERLLMTCGFDMARAEAAQDFDDRSSTPAKSGSGSSGTSVMPQVRLDPCVAAALRNVDLNPHFRALQCAYDELDAALLAPGTPVEVRLRTACALLERWGVDGRPLTASEAAAFDQPTPPHTEVVEHFFREERGLNARISRGAIHAWLAHLAKRDAALAELAALAGAPERIDSLLGRPLRTHVRDDGSVEVEGDVMRLADHVAPESGQ